MAVKIGIPSASSGLSPALKALVDLTPVALLEGKSPEEVNKLRLAVRVLATDSLSKYKPQAVNRKHKRAKLTKPTTSKTTKPAKPVLVSSTTVQPERDESAELAAWLEFYNPPRNRKGNPLMVAYPVDPKEKAQHIRRSQESKASKSHMKNLHAVGITPRAHSGKPQPITKDIEPSWSYFKEAVLKRHLELESLERDLVDEMVKVSCDKVYWQEFDPAGIEMTIERLEAHINESSQNEPVEFVGPPMPVDSTSVEDTIVESITTGQRSLPCDLMTSDDSEAVRYAQALRFHELEPDWHLPFIDIYTLDNYHESEGIAYVEWLRSHDSKSERQYREACNARTNPYHVVNLGEDTHPLYHHNHAAFDKMHRYMLHRWYGNLANDVIKRDGLRNWMHQHWPNTKAKSHTNASGMDLNWLGIDKVIERKHTEEFAERIIDHALRKKSGFAQWSQNIDLGRTRMQLLRRRLKEFRNQRYENYYQFWSWATNVEAEVLNSIENSNVPWDIEGDDGLAMVTIDAANDATISSDTDSPAVETPVTAEVVDLAAHRNKSNDEVDALTSKLRAGLKAKIDGLSDEELVVVTKFFEESNGS